MIIRYVLIFVLFIIVIVESTSINRIYHRVKTEIEQIDKEKSQCPIAWQYFAASCYWKFPVRRSWHEARKECSRFQADLVVIDSDKEFDFIAKNISDLREDFYVGFQYVNDSWSWINHRALSDYTYYSEEDLCEHRLPSEPRHRSCGILDRARRGRLCMNVDVCDRKLNFICEKVVDRCSSLNDICGKHGRCLNTDDGQFRCECHFLFGGPRCRTISPEGSQIILVTIFVVLACLTPIVVRIVYRLLKRQFHRSDLLTQSTHKTSNDENDENFENCSKFFARLSFEELFNSSKLSIFLLSLILGASFLLIIPFLQSQFSSSSSSTSSSFNSTLTRFQQCRRFDNYVWQNFVSLPLALIITLICSCLKRRENFAVQMCRGRPSLPLPLNLFDKRNRHVVAAIFGISANEVMKILEELLLRFNSKNFVTDEGILIELLKRIGIVLLIGMRYFPIFISVNIRHPIASILGLIYTLIDGTYTLIYVSFCSRYSIARVTGTFFRNLSSKEIDQPDFIYLILRHAPHFTCLAFILVKFVDLLIKQIKCSSRKTKNHFDSIDELFQVETETKSEFLYTKNLFKTRSNCQMFYNNILTRPFRRYYRWHRYFTFSTQVLSTYTVVFLVLYNLTCILTFYGIHSIKNQLDRIHLLILQQFNWNIDWGNDFLRDIYISSLISLVIYSIQILNGLIKIQKTLLDGYAGKYIDIPPRHNFSNNELVSKSVHFSGYLCGYTAWGFIIFYKFAFVFCLLVRLWIRYDSRWFQHVLALILPIVLVYLLKHILLSLLSQFVFLQNFGRTTSLNNRRLYFIFNYFNFFFDCFLGIVSCVIRVSKSLCASLIFMGRLDYSFMGRSLERLDQGYATYVTFLHMEILHGHPILVTFSDLIWDEIERKRREKKFLYERIQQTKGNSRRFKWHLFYTLSRNEYLKFSRKHVLNNTGSSLLPQVLPPTVTTNTSILIYDHPTIPAKRSNYRYNFTSEPSSELRLIYQQLKSLTKNVKDHCQIEENDDHYEH